MHRIFLCALVALGLMGLTAEAAPPAVQISATLTGGPKLTASAAGTPFLGTGKLNNYTLRITGGSINGRYVTLTGVVVASNGQTTPFQLDGDSSTGGVRFSYKGALGKMIVLTGKGTVIIS